MFKSTLSNFDDHNLKSFFLSSNQPMLITDGEGKLILEINQSAVKLTGYVYAEYFPQPLASVLKSRQNLLTVIEPEPVSLKINFKQEFTLIAKPGIAEADISSILYQGNEALLFTLNDITDRKLYRALLEDGIEEEINLKKQNQELKKIAHSNLHLALKPLANILGLVNVINESETADQTLVKAINFLKESGRELNDVIKNSNPKLY